MRLVSMAVQTKVRLATLADRVRAEIRAELHRRGVTQADLARDLGRPAMWVSDRLRGAVVLTVDDLDAMAEALDMDAVTFLTAAGNDPPPPRRAARYGDVSRLPRQRPHDRRPAGHPDGSRRTSLLTPLNV
jgi:transcriptional regulator with XRE-family HTH domain